MDTRRLRFFTRVVEIGSISRAARDLHLTQPALSQHMSKLEAELGARLLVRSTQGVQATAAGRQLYRNVQQVLRLLEQAQASVAASRHMVTGRVSLGLPPGTAFSMLPVTVMERASARLPGVMLNIVEAMSSDLRELLTTGRIDIAVVSHSSGGRDLEMQPMFREELRFVLPSHLAAGLDADRPMTCADMNRFDLVLPGPRHDLRRLIDATFARQGLTPHVTYEVDSMMLSSLAVNAGLGGTLLSSALLAMMGPNLNGRNFAIDPAIPMNMALAVGAGAPAGDAVEAIYNLVLDVGRELIANGVWRGVYAFTGETAERA